MKPLFTNKAEGYFYDVYNSATSRTFSELGVMYYKSNALYNLQYIADITFAKSNVLLCKALL